MPRSRLYIILPKMAEAEARYEEYTLRQDKNSQWKIVFWDVIPETSVEGD